MKNVLVDSTENRLGTKRVKQTVSYAPAPVSLICLIYLCMHIWCQYREVLHNITVYIFIFSRLLHVMQPFWSHCTQYCCCVTSFVSMSPKEKNRKDIHQGYMQCNKVRSYSPAVRWCYIMILFLCKGRFGYNRFSFVYIRDWTDAHNHSFICEYYRLQMQLATFIIFVTVFVFQLAVSQGTLLRLYEKKILIVIHVMLF